MIRIDSASFTPYYEQIKRQFKGQIDSGVLARGEPLPSIRDLALSLLLNPNTVARAYRELEVEGFITTRKGKGCFVSENAPRGAPPAPEDGLVRLLDEVLERADREGRSFEEVRDLLEKREQQRAKASKGRKRP